MGQHGAIRIPMAPSSSILFSCMVLTPGWRSVLLGRVDGAPAELCEGAVPVMFCTGGCMDSWEAESGGPARSDRDTHGPVLLHPSRFHGSHPWMAKSTVGSGWMEHQQVSVRVQFH